MKNFRYLENVAELELDKDTCIGCGMCVTACPHRVFTLIDKKAEIVDFGGCMECGACALNCPVDAIHVNPDDKCGCATLIIQSWIAKYTGKNIGGGCC